MTWVLIIILSAGSYDGGVTTLQQEFSTFEKCEKARKHIESSKPQHWNSEPMIKAQGCFEK